MSELQEIDHFKPTIDACELPGGERILLQTKPDWWRMSLSVFCLKAISTYFGLFALWRFGSTYHDTGSLAQASDNVLAMLPPFAFGVGLLMLLAFLTARQSSFTITDRRIVVRYGVALPAQLNVPLKDVQAAGVHLYGDGSADIPFALPPGGRARPSYFQLWPYVRPFSILSGKPMLRAVPDGARVANILSDALVAAQGGERRQVEDDKHSQSVGGGVPVAG